MGLRAQRGCAGKARGFAFAGFMCRAHAEKAIKVANGQVIDPPPFTPRIAPEPGVSLHSVPFLACGLQHIKHARSSFCLLWQHGNDQDFQMCRHTG